LKLEAAGSATWSVDNASQKETPAEGRGSKTSLGSVTLFPPREAFFLTCSLSLPNWHCDSCWWTACRLSSARFLSPVHHPVATSAGCLACGMGLLNTQRDRRLSANVVAYTAILVQQSRYLFDAAGSGRPLRENHISSQFNEPKRNPPTADGFGQTEAQTTFQKTDRSEWLRVSPEKTVSAGGNRRGKAGCGSWAPTSPQAGTASGVIDVRWLLGTCW